jgi:excisionase family DNA binding protein
MGTGDKLLGPTEVAAYLDVPKATLYSWRYRHEGPRSVRVGRHLRYRWSDLNRWLDARSSDQQDRPG